jgi:peroxiredoxin
MIRTRIFPLLLALALIAPPIAARAADPPTSRNAPDTKFVTLDGKPASLKDYKGKVVLIDFWATWCGPCRMEMPTLQKLHTAMESKGLVVLGVSIDRNPGALVPPFLKKMGITYPNVADDAQSPTSARWGVTAIPSLFLIDRNGQIVRQWRGMTPEAELTKAIETVLADGK